MKIKGSLRRIPKEMRMHIHGAALSDDNRKLNRDDLAEKLASELLERFGKAPTEDTLKRLISGYRNSPRLPEDEYWGVKDLRDYTLHPQTKQAIFDLKIRGHHGITIRQALWMDRLLGLPLSNDKLFIYASLYAEAEKLEATLGIDFDTTVIDLLLEKTLSEPEKAQQEGARWDDEERIKKGISELLKFGDLMMTYDDQKKEKKNV